MTAFDRLAPATVGIGAISYVVALAFARRGASAGKRVRDRRRETGSIAGLALQGVAFALVFALGSNPTHAATGVAITRAVVTLGLTAASLGLFVWSTRAMGANWSLVARTRADHQLITNGPFRYFRHPIYVALLLYLIAAAVGVRHVGALVVALPCYALGTIVRVVHEEALLRQTFGAAYDDYADRVGRFVPRSRL